MNPLGVEALAGMLGSRHLKPAETAIPVAGKSGYRL